MDKCKKSMQNLKASKEKTALLEAAVYLRDKHADQALDHLEVICLRVMFMYLFNLLLTYFKPSECYILCKVS